MITLQDKELLAKKGISEEQIAEQLACFEKGFPYLKLSAAASVEQGILAPDADEQKKYLNAWEAYTQTDKTVVKFVPASGAASPAMMRESVDLPDPFGPAKHTRSPWRTVRFTPSSAQVAPES